MHCFRAVVELAGKLGDICISPRTPVRRMGESDRGLASPQETNRARGRELRFTVTRPCYYWFGSDLKTRLGKFRGARFVRLERSREGVALDSFNRPLSAQFSARLSKDCYLEPHYHGF